MLELELDKSVMAPLKLLFPAMFRKAPSELTPVPDKLSGSDAMVIFPLSCSAESSATVVPLMELPRAALFCALRTPSFIWVGP